MLSGVFHRKDPWPAVVDKAARSAVVLGINKVRSWDGSAGYVGMASGFVVDKKRGIILTTAAVATRGPITGRIIQDEEVNVTPLYVDPEHDFAFLKFDPKEFEYTQLGELELYPEGAKVGVEIRVIGSDAGERMMVLDGTLSDCKRPVLIPAEESIGFADMNIFYITSSAGVADGSTGAPVLDSRGRVVALNTGGVEDAASSFFMPLHRVVRALKILQNGLGIGKKVPHIPRGTLQIIWEYLLMDELVRMGLTKAEETALRKANYSGIDCSTVGGLIIQSVNKGSPAEVAGLKVGDILLTTNGKTVVDFLVLETILDDNIGKTITLEVRRDSERLSFTVLVQDMNKDFPKKEFIEYSGGVIQTLGYSPALFADLPIGSVLATTVTNFSFQLVFPYKHAIVKQVGEHKIESLDDFERAITSYHHGEKVPFRIHPLDFKTNESLVIVTIDRKWFPICRRYWDESTLKWVTRPCSLPSSPAPNPRRPSVLLNRRASFGFLRARAEPENIQTALPGLVWINCTNPTLAADVEVFARYDGCGVVLDAKRGLVFCDRMTVPTFLSEVTMMVGSSFEIPCKVIYFHPLYNFAFLQYDPTLLGATELQSLDLFDAEESGETDLVHGDVLDFCGLTSTRRVTTELVLKVTRFERNQNLAEPSVGFVPRSFVSVRFDRQPEDAVGGIFLDNKKRCRAFLIGRTNQPPAAIHSTLISISLKKLQAALDKTSGPAAPVLSVGCFPVDLTIIPLSAARSDYGLDETWTQKLARAADSDVTGPALGAREVLKVVNSLGGTDFRRKLRGGDLLLAVNGEPALDSTRLNLLALKAADEGKTLIVTVLRDRQLIELSIYPAKLDCCGARRMVTFAGAMCQEAPLAALYGTVPSFVDASIQRGVLICGLIRGSPAEAFALQPTNWLISINSEPVIHLDDVVRLIREVKHGESVMLGTFEWDGQETVQTLDLDLEFFPTTDRHISDETGEVELTVVKHTSSDIVLA